VEWENDGLRGKRVGEGGGKALGRRGCKTRARDILRYR